MTKLSVILALAMLLVSAKDVRSQSDDAPSRETLKGLNAIRVQVLCESCKERRYIAASLQNEVELQLRMAGIKVLPPGTKAQATLRVFLQCYGLGGDIIGYVYSQETDVVQWIKWPFDRSPTVTVTTWSSSKFLGTESDNDAPRVREVILRSVKEFVNTWLAVNR